MWLQRKKEYILKHPENNLLYDLFIPGSIIGKPLTQIINAEYIETQCYIFVVPQGSITNEVNIDME